MLNGFILSMKVGDIIVDEMLAKLHQVQLNMAIEIDRVCKKNKINYFIIAGTLLGAVRHQGFIPWDDDIDIGMLRNDYEKFVNLPKEEFNEEYYLQSWDNDSGFGWPFAKIRKNNTTFIEGNAANTNTHNGIFIDIFPFDNVPPNNLQKKTHNFTTLLLKKIFLIKQGYTIWDDSDKVKKYVHLFLKSVTKPISSNTIKRNLYTTMTKYNLEKVNEVVTFGGSYGYTKETIKLDWVKNTKSISFDGYQFSCPNNIEAYLTHMYGDYMTPPPENKRYNKHNITTIKF